MTQNSFVILLPISLYQDIIKQVLYLIMPSIRPREGPSAMILTTVPFAIIRRATGICEFP